MLNLKKKKKKQDKTKNSDESFFIIHHALRKDELELNECHFGNSQPPFKTN